MLTVCLTFCELKITNILKSMGRDWNRVSCNGNSTNSRQSFNGLRRKLGKIALFMYLR